MQFQLKKQCVSQCRDGELPVSPSLRATVGWSQQLQGPPVRLRPEPGHLCRIRAGPVRVGRSSTTVTAARSWTHRDSDSDAGMTEPALPAVARPWLCRSRAGGPGLIRTERKLPIHRNALSTSEVRCPTRPVHWRLGCMGPGTPRAS